LAVVAVKFGNIDMAARQLRKILTEEEVFKKLRDRRHYSKPSVVKKLKKIHADKRRAAERSKLRLKAE